ncbi:MAG: hypothetical protein WCB27_01865 [Thermoguttaceae bacterium]
MRTCESPVVTDSSKTLTPTPSPVCTRVCTSEPENANADAHNTTSLGTSPQAPDASQGNGSEGIDQGDPLAKLAAALLTLSPADRAKLATMLTMMGNGQTLPRCLPAAHSVKVGDGQEGPTDAPPTAP